MTTDCELLSEQARPPGQVIAGQQWVEVFSRDRADLGPGHAATRVDQDVERYGAQAPSRSASLPAAALAERRRRPEELRPIGARPVGPGIGL